MDHYERVGHVGQFLLDIDQFYQCDCSQTRWDQHEEIPLCRACRPLFHSVFRSHQSMIQDGLRQVRIGYDLHETECILCCALIN